MSDFDFRSSDGAHIAISRTDAGVSVYQDVSGAQGRGAARLSRADARALAQAISDAAQEPDQTEQAPA